MQIRVVLKKHFNEYCETETNLLNVILKNDNI